MQRRSGLRPNGNDTLNLGAEGSAGDDGKAEGGEGSDVYNVWTRERVDSPRSITSLNREETLHQIEYVSELIQSGQSEDYTLSTSYEGRTTSDFRQYVYWLQQHAKELEGAKPQADVKA